MLHVETVRYKNFMSTGNAFTEFRFDEHRTTLVVGDNGSGKSSIIEALFYGLYNRPFRKINKPQLLNSITQRGLLVEVDFRIGGHSYTVRRGMRPAVFEIWRDGVLMNQDAAARDYQEHLEKNVLKMTHKTFSQIVVLGSAGYVPFMQLPAGQRREMIEDLLDIQIFSTMGQVLRSRIAENRDAIADLTRDVEVEEKTLDVTLRHINAMRVDHEESIARQEAMVVELHEKRLEQEDALRSVEALERDLRLRIANFGTPRARLTELQGMESKIDARVRGVQKTISFYETNSSCPTCRQSIDEDFRQREIQEKRDRVSELNEALVKLEGTILKSRARVDELNALEDEHRAAVARRSELVRAIDYTDRSIRAIDSEIAAIRDRVARPLPDVDVDAIRDRISDLESRRAAAMLERDTMQLAQQLLKDGGIKTKIIRQFVPIINRLINKYLSSLDFFVSFELDESFNETIKSRFRDEFSYASFSEGEKARIDLAILFTWRAVANLRNSSATNILVMDEVFDSSLDSTGIDELLKIIGTHGSGNNIVVISHRGDVLQDKFDSVVRFRKVSNFSQVVD